MSLVAWIATHAGAIVLFAFLCHGTGSLLMDRLGRNAAMATALGMGIFAQTLFVLGVVGALTKFSVICILVVMAVCALLPVASRQLPDWPLATGHWLLAFATLPAFLLALYPPVGFDATMYHLPFAKAFAREGALVYLDNLRFPVFPQLAEMLFTAALLVADDVTAQLTQWLAIVITALATARLGGKRAGLFAAALFLGTPLTIFLGGNAYIDATLAMFVTLALCAWLEWRRTASTGWLVLAGAFAGMGAATKYHGLFFVVVFFLAVLRVRIRAGAIFLAVALLVAGPWYARIAWHTGNPFFPFFSSIFGRSEWRTLVDQSLARTAADPVSAVVTDPVSLARGAVRGAFLDPITGGRPPHSPWVLLLLPLGIAGAVIDRRLLYPFAAAMVYALLLSSLDWRFLIPIVPLVSVCIALALDRLWSAGVPAGCNAGAPPAPGAAARRRRFSRRDGGVPWTALIAALLILPGFAWGSLLIAKYGPIPTTPAQRDAFIARKIPVYPALRALNERHGSQYTAYVLRAANAAYYCDGRFLGDDFGPYRFALVEPFLDDPAKLHAVLRRFGADYFIVPGPPPRVDRVRSP